MKIALVIPAAGIGARMQADRPKQYLPLAGKTILEVTAQVLLDAQPDAPLFIAVSDTDPYFATLAVAAHPRVTRVPGGKERADSVLSALMHIDATLFPWVLVHDAARPLLRHDDLTQLLLQCQTRQMGGILASPVRDTMKRGISVQGVVQVLETVERKQLWHALTPQVFPTVQLRDALSKALLAGIAITDEASAMEWAGYPVQLVAGRADNIKVTQPEDLALARFYLEQA